jgi:hypothetical protein
MRLDPAEVLGDTVGTFVKRLLIFLSAVTLGGSLGELVDSADWMMRGNPVEIARFGRDVMQGPRWILGSLFSDIGILIFGLFCVFVFTTWRGHWWWLGTVVLVSAFVSGHNGAKVGWIVWVVLTAMVGTGVWFLRALDRNRWGGELRMIEIENQMRRAEAEAEARAEVERLQREE